METKQQLAVRLTRTAVDALIRSIRAMPEDRRDWKVSDVARSPIEQLQECAQVPDWFVTILAERRSPFVEGFLEAQSAERAQWTDLDELETRLRESTERMVAAILALPDEDLEKTIETAPGRSMVLGDVCFFAYRNLWYHIGQVGFIQTLYGDWQMH